MNYGGQPGTNPQLGDLRNKVNPPVVSNRLHRAGADPRPKGSSPETKECHYQDRQPLPLLSACFFGLPPPPCDGRAQALNVKHTFILQGFIAAFEISGELSKRKYEESLKPLVRCESRKELSEFPHARAVKLF
uniref:Uncharacterized protein n=1 Tax=Coccidioides posadasii RMSCC 3488 TaxID=454284 RepID=A0A0J6F6Q5_COCPO|nr:hypothetical protein CPAG_04932 [Coccidioides posadasii RMSCC 3488]